MEGEYIRDTATGPETGPWETGQRVFGEIEKSEGRKGLRKTTVSGFVFKELCIWQSGNGEEARAGPRTSTKTAISSRTRAGVGRTNSCSKAILVRPEKFL